MINALKYTEILEKVGFTADQSKTTVRLWLELMDSNFATKSDLKELEYATKENFVALRSEMKEMERSLRSDMKEMESSLRSDMKEMESSLRSDMKQMESSFHSEFQNIRFEMRDLENRLTIKLGSLMALGLGIMAAILKF